MNPTVLLGIILLQCSVAGNSILCLFGEQVNTSKEGNEVCIECPDGTFMPLESHSKRECYKCTAIENPTLEIETTKCNRTHDTVIDCICGYYRYFARREGEKDECRPNKQCPLPVQPSPGDGRSFTKSTTLMGVTEDANNNAEGKSTINTSLNSHECIQFPNVTSCQDSGAYYVATLCILCITLTVILAILLSSIFWNGQCQTYLEQIPIVRAFSRFITIVNYAFLLLPLVGALIVCIVLKTIDRQAFNDAFVVIILAASLVYMTVISFTRCGSRVPNKSYDKEGDGLEVNSFISGRHIRALANNGNTGTPPESNDQVIIFQQGNKD